MACPIFSCERNNEYEYRVVVVAKQMDSCRSWSTGACCSVVGVPAGEAFYQ